MKRVLDKIVNPFQSTFVEGRYTADDYIIVYEILRSFQKKRKSKAIGLKLDMSKAYARMEYDLNLETLTTLAFHKDLVAIIRVCITSVFLNPP